MEETPAGGFSDDGAPRRGQRLGARTRARGAHPRPDLARRARSPPRPLAREPHPAQQALPRPRLVHRGGRAVQGATGRPAKPLDVRVDSRRFVGVKLTGDSAFGVITDLRARALGQRERSLAGRTMSMPSSRRWSTSWRGPRDGDGADPPGSGISIGGNVADQRSRHACAVPRLARRRARRSARARARHPRHRRERRHRPHHRRAVVRRGARATPPSPSSPSAPASATASSCTTASSRPPDSGLGLGGHLPLDPSGPLCMEGHRGCSTAMLSIPSITAQVGIALGREVDYDEVLALAGEGHPIAVLGHGCRRARARPHDGLHRQHRHGRHDRALGRGRRARGPS